MDSVARALSYFIGALDSSPQGLICEQNPRLTVYLYYLYKNPGWVTDYDGYAEFSEDF
jgi:hypothetical protein